MKRKTAHIELTEEQIEKLKPLLKAAEKRPLEMMILAQGYPEHGVAIFGLCTPDDVTEILNKSEQKCRPGSTRKWGRVGE